MIQESCPDISRTTVRIIAELSSECYKMLVPNRQESSLCNEIKTALVDYQKISRQSFSDAIVCIVPSHEKDKYSDGLRSLTDSITRAFGYDNAWDLIVRTKTHEKLSTGGNRSIEGLIDSMSLNPDYDIRSKLIIVFDDITTSGNTMEAVRRLLNKKGPANILSITLGRTVEGTPIQNNKESTEEKTDSSGEKSEPKPVKTQDILPLSDKKDNDQDILEKLGAKYSVLLCGQRLSDYLDKIKIWLDYGVKVLWFGDQASKDTLENIDHGKEYRDAYLLQTFVVSGYSGIIYDGNDDNGLIDRLEAACPSFNAAQYRVEHCSSSEHIVVQASAGTGKTTVMIDRIMYLMHTVPNLHMYDIYMITFTNDATEEMNRRLQKALLTRYHLTGNVKYFRWVEEQSQMRISTIHSFCYDVLRKYGVKQGFTENLSIKGFRKERKDLINGYIDRRLLTDVAIKQQIGNSLYNTQFLLDIFWNECAKVGISHEAIHNLQWGQGTQNEESRKFTEFLKEGIPALDDEFFEEKRRLDAISLSDIIRDLQMVLAEFVKQGAQGVAVNGPLAGLGMKYLFIDEFQDTDLSQIDVAIQLVKLTGTKLFVVGDVKQSIYGFRGANDEAFDVLYKALDTLEDNVGRKDFSLKNNYRTAAKLMKSMDEKFERWGKTGRLKYDNPVIPLNPDEGEPLIIYHCTQPETTSDILFEETEEDKEAAEVISANKASSQDESQPSAKEIAENTRKALDNLLERVPNMPKEPNEKTRVVLLTRTNSQLDQLSMLLRKYKIPSVSKREGYFYKSEAVRDFYALICSFLYENEPKHMFNFLMTPYAGDVGTIDLKHLEKLNGDKYKIREYLNEFMKKTSWSTYRDKLRLEPIIAVLKDIKQEIPIEKNYIVGTKRLLIDEGWKEDDAKASTFARTIQYMANLEKLIELIQNDFSDERLSLYTLYTFLKTQIATNREEEEPETKNINDYTTVLCMTTHKSKGLEFDTIILPYTGRKLPSKKREELIIDTNSLCAGWNGGGKLCNEFYDDMHKKKVDKDRKEEHRILYVAMTRAINRLIVIEPMKPKEDTWAEYIGS